MKVPLAIRAVGMVSSVGNSALECSTSVRAGIQRVAASALRSRLGSPVRMGLVPSKSLGDLVLREVGARASRHRRILRLARSAIMEASEAFGGLTLPVSIVTSLHDDLSSYFLDDLATMLGPRVDRAASRHLAVGSAGVFVALLDAAHRIAEGEAAVMVVAADSMFDPQRLDGFQRSKRLLVDRVMDGFIPGEGAAALVLTAAAPGSLATIARAGVAHDDFRPDEMTALTGDGLTSAVHDALAGTPAPAREVWASLNGESWNAKEWGLAARRAHRALARGLAIRHPVECFGDPGAALGAMLLVLASMSLYRAKSPGPGLVWSHSDDGFRGAARLERA